MPSYLTRLKSAVEDSPTTTPTPTSTTTSTCSSDDLDETLTSDAVVSNYANAVCRVYNEGECLVSLEQLKQASVQLLLNQPAAMT